MINYNKTCILDFARQCKSKYDNLNNWKSEQYQQRLPVTKNVREFFFDEGAKHVLTCWCVDVLMC